MSIIQGTQYVDINGRKVKTKVRRHRQARRISLRLTSAGDGIVITLPVRASLDKALKFMLSKSDWVLQHVVDNSALIRLTDGAIIPVLGENYTIKRMQGRGVTRLHAGMLEVYGAENFTARRVSDFLKKHLQRLCYAEAVDVAARIGKKVQNVRIGNMESRWGSCTTSGRLAFNWRLVFAPLGVVQYLVAHEVAHLAEMNHSPKFWRVVAELCPSHAEARKWLKANGQDLYRFK